MHRSNDADAHLPEPTRQTLPRFLWILLFQLKLGCGAVWMEGGVSFDENNYGGQRIPLPKPFLLTMAGPFVATL